MAKRTCRVVWFNSKTGRRVKASTARKVLGTKLYATTRAMACRSRNTAVGAHGYIAVKEGEKRLVHIVR